MNYDVHLQLLQNINQMAAEIYDKEKHCELVYILALLGCTGMEMARVMKININTLNKWKREHPEFLEKMEAGKDIADAAVVRWWYKNCIGYEYEEEEARVIKGVLQVVKVKKRKLPDPWSIARWLSIRQRDKWSETHRVDVTQTINIMQLTAHLEQYMGIEDLKQLEQLGFKIKELPPPEAYDS